MTANEFAYAVAAVFATGLAVYAMSKHRKYVREQTWRVLQQRFDVARVLDSDFDDKRRVWLLARIAKGETFADIYDEEWETLP